ncbi:MAG: hypothetical protein AB2563_03315 [Candidatus Thiodiazotropha endolucinida]
MNTEWTESQFEELTWHDNAVHGLSIREGKDGTGELELDIDHILEWLEPKKGFYRFLVAPASLVFHDVCDLVININYKEPTAGFTPFSISQIEREDKITANGFKTHIWNIGINWPIGFIEFQSSGFTQNLKAKPIESDTQTLRGSERYAVKP